MANDRDGDYEIIEYDRGGTPLYIIRDKRKARVYGPYWKREHADDFMRLVLKTSPTTHKVGTGIMRILFGAFCGAALSNLLGLTPHEYYFAFVVGLTALIFTR